MRQVGVLCLILAVAGATHALHLQLENMALPESIRLTETLPSTAALRLMSLGYEEAVADYYWLRAINHFGDGRMHGALYPNLGPILERVIGLDPYFASAYIFAGTALTLNGMDFHVPVRLLQQGLRYRPDVWRIPMTLGFNLYHFLNDYAGAARAMALAADKPGAPDFLGPLTTRLAAAGGTPEVGLSMVRAMLQNVSDAKLVAMYRERERLLLLELALQKTQSAVDAWQKEQGAPPPSLEALVRGGVLEQVPEDPLGGTLSLQDGRVVTRHETERLRLPAGATLKEHLEHASD